MKKKYDVTGMMCAACQANVSRCVSKLDGVNDASVSLLGKNMVVDFDESKITDQDIIDAVTDAGYGCSVFVNESIRDIQRKRDAVLRKTLRRLIWSIVLLALLMVFSMGPMIPPIMEAINASPQMPLICVLNVSAQLLFLVPIVVLNIHHYSSGFKALFKGHPNMESLVALGSTASALYGLVIFTLMLVAFFQGRSEDVMRYSMSIYFESAAMIPVFISLGKYFEARATNKTTASIAALMALTPETAILIRDQKEVEVQTEEIAEGDVVFVKPGMSIPVDGVVLTGHGNVDESAISGEALPVFKDSGAKVVAGTINKEGSFTFRVTGVGQDTTIAKIVALVQEAADSKAPIARLADRIASIFVPAVIGVSLLTFVVWMILSGVGLVGVSRPDWGLAIQLSVSVMVISCPCALGLATPIAIMVGAGKGAENGVLIKSAEAFETAAKVDVVLFDKTGTLTKGEMRVADIVAYEGEENDLLRSAASLERHSEHPLSKAIVLCAKDRGIDPLPSDDFENIPGKGVAGNGLLIGNVALMEERGVAYADVQSDLHALSEQGKTVLLVAKKNRVIGLFAIADEAKENAASTIKTLQKMGKRVAIVTGDSKKTAAAIAAQLGVDEVYAETLPAEKEQIVSALQKDGAKVAFVGDGINDAPALTKANVGIAIGAGTEVAIESSDIILARNDPRDVAGAFALSAAVLKNAKENLTWAFVYNAVLIPLAAGAFYGIAVIPNWFTGSQAHLVLTPMIGSIAMSLSSVTVVLNALRLRFFKGLHQKEEQ